MEFVVIGLISAFNMLIIKVKLEKKRYEDAFFDLALMSILAFLFSGSYGGMVVAMVASLSVSLYLLVSPPKFTAAFLTKAKKHIDEINEANGFRKPLNTKEKSNLMKDMDKL